MQPRRGAGAADILAMASRRRKQFEAIEQLNVQVNRTADEAHALAHQGPSGASRRALAAKSVESSFADSPASFGSPASVMSPQPSRPPALAVGESPMGVLSPFASSVADGDDKSKRQDAADDESNIVVAVRCRPMSERERQLDAENVISIVEGAVVVLLDSTVDQSHFFRKSKDRREFRYAFDFAFDQTCSQRFVFERTTRILLGSVMEGYNATVCDSNVCV
jgi:hypothetical protein